MTATSPGLPPGEGDVDPVARMSDLDALLWALEGDPLLRSTIVVVGVLDRAPGREALYAHMERSSRRFPRLRQRVVRSPLGLAPPRWELDPAFDIDYHVRVVGAPGPEGEAGLVELLELAEPMASEGFDAARPPWQVTVVEGLKGGGAGVVAKLHHALTDGVGAVQLAMSVFDLEPNCDPGPMPARPDEPLSTDMERALDDLDFGLRRTASLARKALPWMARGLRDVVTAPEAQLRGALALARSVARTTAPGGRPLSPVMSGRSLRTRLDVLSVSLADLRQAARAAGGTVNDAFLAGVVGGLRRYHEKHGERPEALRVGVAVNRRGGADGRGATAADLFGNAFAPLRLLVPLQIADPGDRVASLGALVRRALGEPALDLLGTAATVAGTVSRAASVAAVGSALRSTDVIASNVPGSPVPLYVAGASLLRLVAFGPRSGAAVNFTLLSHLGAVEVGVNADLLAVPDPDTLVACLRAGFDEVLELAGR
ncbi:MAG TPA: wax ester/triacylglycerol synthase domain-containing protein [Acidimicrobiales bacterium]|nr:wax ester/triacylglycerol synthase domain-containing protein [Acidimicrobiales bacterium]